MKFNQKSILSLLILLIGAFCPLLSSAEAPKKTDKSKIRVIGRVKDAASRKDLVKAKVYLTDSLGAVIDSTQTGGWYMGDSRNMFELAHFQFALPRNPANYVIEVRMPDYQDTYYNLTLDKIGRREFDRNIPDIYMEKAARQLDEVVVTTSKVKFYNKGDTIVFNADAFELAEGSMLDALIKQLPGVELKEGGKIYVNGEFVENLLLNGKDFFKGKNEIMLDNLGAYAVKDVQVYKRSPELQEWAGDKGQQELVMDVKLKKEYNMGWIMNFEAGVGTSDRYMGRAFINRFTNNSRISVLGNINNLNDNRKPGESSTWTPETNTTGTMITQMGGIDYYVQEAEEKWKVTGDATVRHTSQHDYRETSRLNFLGTNRTYDYDFMNNKTKSLSLSTSHRATIRPGRTYLGVGASADYNKINSNVNDIGGAFNDEQPEMTSEILEALYSGHPDLLDDVINRSKIKTKNSGHSANANVYASGSWSLPGSSDYLMYNASFNYFSNKNEAWRDYIVNYGSDPTPALRQNRYFDNSPNRNYKANASLGYQYVLSESSRVTLGYGYTHGDYKQDSYAYALDRLEDQGVFGTLPEGYLATMDAGQSYRSHTIENSHSINAQYSYWGKRVNVYLNPSVQFVNKNFSYFRNNIDHRVDQHAVLVTVPEFMARVQFNFNEAEQNGRKFYRHRLTLLPAIQSTLPDLVKMVDIVDDNDPLNIWTGNRNLKPSYKYKGYLQWYFRAPIGNYTFNNFAEFVYSYTRDQIVNGYRYDTETGVRTYRTYNVPDGNTSTNFHINPSLQFGSKGQFTASIFGGLDFIRSSDMIGINADPVKSQVHTYWSVGKFNFSWQLGKQSLTLRGEVNSRHTTSETPGFNPITGTHSNVALSGNFKLPKGFGIATDFTVYMRRGYGSPELNTTDPVMNLRLSYAPVKTNWTFMLDGFDLFHQLTNVNYTVNSQGRTVVWNNVLPRYFMLHVQYKLNIQPKKKIIDNRAQW